MSTLSVRRSIPIGGMDCADCAVKIERRLRDAAGVYEAQVSLAAERAVVVFDPARTSTGELGRAIESLGYRVRGADRHAAARASDFVSGLMVSLVALLVLGGLLAERLGWLDATTRLVPWPVAAAAVLIGGYPIFRKVVLALRARMVTPHALMTLGIIGALSIGEYGAAAVIVFFMRFADFLDGYTAGRARQAIQEIVALQPLDARVEDGDGSRMVPAAQVRPNQVVFIKPGERVPVDGVIVSGHASINQAPLTGESVPVARGPGDAVLAATVNLDGVLRVRAEHVGPDSTFGRIVRLVEEADAHKSTVQRFADRVTAYYIPLVAAAAAAAWFVGGSLSASVAVLVVSCSCGIALATPVAVLAAVGRAARRGILIKGGAALEGLARADVVLLDKTGTLTLGRPQVTGVHPAAGRAAEEVLAIAARAERYSEHPLAAAIMAAARPVSGGDAVAAVDVAPGRGVKLTSGDRAMVGSRRFLDEEGVAVPGDADALAGSLAAEGHTVVYVAREGTFAGLIALADRPRAGVAGAIASLRRLGIREIVMLTGDSERVAAAVAAELGVDYRAGLLPEGKIDDVRRRQADGRIVAMIGDGINDAPALAQADAGIAMDAATGAAIEAADVALMKDDWTLIPEAVRIGREAFAVIRQNLLSAVAYNIIGVTLAVAGVLPPVIAAAGQIIPDVLILLNSGRLLRSRPIKR